MIRNMEAKPHLRKNNRIKSIHSSLKIEANSLSLEQVRDVSDGHIVPGEQKEIQEVKMPMRRMKKMLSVMEYGVPYTSKAIMDKLGLKSKETFRKNYLNPAMEMHMVEMTIPDKPRSRNQRYVKI